jgi:plasmid segregation protein ParM
MRTEKVNVIGVDLGYDSIKMMAKGEKIIFPSLVEEEEEGILLENSLEVLKNEEVLEKFDMNKIIIKIQDKTILGYNDESFNTYRVGNYVLNQRSSSVGYSLSDQKYKEPEEFAKLLSGISLLFPKADKIIIKNLVTGLPIKYYEKHKESFKKELVNTFKVQIKNIRNQFITKEIEIRKATVIPQGLASYYDFIMDIEGLVTTNIEGGLGLIDLGGLTIDCVAFNDGELIKDSPISFNDGVRTRIFKKIQDGLDIDISQDLIKKQILAGKDFIRVRNETYQFKDIKDYAIDKLSRDIALQIKNRWESFLMIDKILITGGATVLLFENIDKYLEGFPCEKVDNKPQFSNCRGYVKLGKALVRKREQELKAKLKERTNQAAEEVAVTTTEG